MSKHCKLHEKGLITKGHRVMHTHLKFIFKSTLYCSTLSIKAILSHNCERNTMNQLQSFFQSYDTTTFKTNVLHLVSNKGQVKHPLLLRI